MGFKFTGYQSNFSIKNQQKVNETMCIYCGNKASIEQECKTCGAINKEGLK